MVKQETIFNRESRLEYMSEDKKVKKEVSSCFLLIIFLLFRYLAPLTNLAAQTEFSQREKDCSP